MGRPFARVFGGDDLLASPAASSTSLVPVERKDDPVVLRAAGSGNYVPYGQPVTSPWSVDKIVRNAYERVPWLWKSVDAIAEKEASLRIRCVTGEVTDPDDITFVDNDPILPLLNQRSAPQIRGMQGLAYSFRYRMTTLLLLSKPGVFVEVVRNRRGGVFSLSLLPPQWTLPIPDPDMLIGGYQVWVPGAPRYVLPAYDPESEDSNSVIWIAKPHPTDPFSGTIAVEAAGLSLESSFYATLYNRNFLMNDGRPGGLLSLKDMIDDDSIAELRSRFGGGVVGAGRVSVVQGSDISWVDTAVSPRDAQYSQTRDQTKNDILEGATGVPETMLGHAADRTYDNADAEREVFWTETMPPHLTMIERAFEPLTAGGYEDGVRLWHDTSQIEVLRRSYEKKVDRANTEFGAGLITVDEYRELTGRDPFNVPGTSVVYVAGSRAPVGAKADQEAAEKLTVLPISSSQASSQAKEAAGQGAPGQPAGPPAAARTAPGGVGTAGPTSGRGGLRVLQGGAKAFTNADGSTGAMVALGLDDGSASVFADFTDDPRTLHCTLLFLGKADAFDVDERQTVLQAVDDALDGVGTLSGKVSAIVPFVEGDGSTAWVALLDVPDLAEVATDVRRNVKAAGFDPPSSHGFTAHVTLSRGATGPDAQALVGKPVVLDTVILAFGDEVDERPLDDVADEGSKELAHAAAPVWV